MKRSFTLRLCRVLIVFVLAVGIFALPTVQNTSAYITSLSETCVNTFNEEKPQEEPTEPITEQPTEAPSAPSADNPEAQSPPTGSGDGSIVLAAVIALAALAVLIIGLKRRQKKNRFIG